MKKSILLFLPFLLFAAGAFVSCEEVEETSKYDNWRERNEAFIDSLKRETGPTYVTDADQADKMEIGKLYAILVQSESTDKNPQYIYCKKLKKTDGQRPLYTSIANTYYYGTVITGDRFDGNFTGYSATDQGALNAEVNTPTEFDSPLSFPVNGVIAGWITALQYMCVGERWIVYIPWQCAYGASGSGSISGYSALTFDMILKDIVE